MSHVQGPSHLQIGKLEASLDYRRPCLTRVKNFNTTKFTMTSPPEISNRSFQIRMLTMNRGKQQSSNFEFEPFIGSTVTAWKSLGVRPQIATNTQALTFLCTMVSKNSFFEQHSLSYKLVILPKAP